MPAETQPRETIFYDGTCGLCHALVRFTAQRDAAGWFVFAPLGGELFQKSVSQPRVDLPDTAVVLTREGRLLLRSQAVLHVMRRLGGPWQAVARVLSFLPRSLCDRGYDLVARTRRKLFAAPAGSCPVLPPHLRSRFRS